MTPTPQDRELGVGSLWPRLSETWDELVWPRVLTAAKRGLRPALLGLAFFAIIIVGLLLNVGFAVDFALGGALPAWRWLEDRDETRFLLLWRAYISLPWSLARNLPVTTLLFGPLSLAVWAVMLGAISRMVASEVSLGRRLAWTQALALSLRRWHSLLGAVAGPLILVWLIALAMGAAGFLLMQWPVLNLLGSLLFGLFLIGGAAATIILVGYILGRGMLIPAVVCEGADAVDAIQRTYSYVLSRPLRLVLYLLLAIVGILVTVGILALLTYWTIGFATQGAAVWAGSRGRATVWLAARDALGFAAPANPAPAADGQPAGTFAAAAWIIRLWILIPLGLLLASWLSCSMAAMTVVYLAMRRVCDGQDLADLWMPGMIEANMASAMAGRARAAAEMGTPPASRPPAGDADDL